MRSPHAAKIAQPSRSRLLLHRSRLTDFLHENIERRLVIISASAGYGKTSLLVDFAHETSLPICWYGLESSDRDPQCFLENLIASVRCRFPNVGERAGRMLASEVAGCDPDAVVGALATEIRQDGISPFVIVLDDYHNVADSDAINRVVDTLLYLLPPKAHVIIASRTLPAKLDLTRLQIRQQVVSVGIGELQFTADEIRALVLQNHHIEIPTERAVEMAARSEGWIAGILLTTPALWPGVFQRLIQEQGAQEKVFQFLASETFEHLSPELQRFLLDASIFNRLEVSTCDQVLGTQNTGELLRAIEEQNLFVVRFTDEGYEPLYRFHNLFHEFLRQRLSETDPNRWRDLNYRAATMFETRNTSLGQAIAHYLAIEMFDDAARVIEQIAQATFDAGRWTPLAGWIDALPTQVLDDHPSLIVMRGMVFAETGKNAEAEAAYTRAIELHDRRGDKISAAKAIVWRAMLWNLVGRHSEAVRACETVLPTLHDNQAQWEEARAFRVLGSAHVHLGEFPRCVRELETGLALYEALGDETRVAWLHHDIGTCLRIHGDASADEHYRQALDYWRQTDNVVGLATTLNSIGVGCHLVGDYPRAIATLEEACALADRTGNYRSQAFALASLGDVHRDLGKYSHALEVYRQAIDLSQRVGGFILTYGLVALGETYRLAGDEKNAADCLRQASESAESHQSNYEIGLTETALGIWACKQGQIADSILHLNRAAELLKKMRRDCIRAQLHLARAHFLRRRYANAQRELKVIATQFADLCPASIPFLIADKAQLLPLIKYAASKKIGAGYFRRVLDTVASLDRARGQSASPTIEVRAFGATQVTIGNKVITKSDWSTSTAKELFFLLLSNPNGLRREQVQEALWPNKPAAAASVSFHSSLYRLRRVIPKGLIYGNEIYALRRELPLWYDVAQFEALIDRAQAAKGVTERIEAYAAAVALYRGEFFEESYSDWCLEIRTRLRRKYLDALLALAEIYERQGDPNKAVNYYQALIERDTDREEIYRALMRLQIKLGDRLAAARTYQRCAQVLQDELNIDSPSEETQRLYEQISKDIPNNTRGS